MACTTKSSVSPNVEIGQDLEVISSNATDLSSANTSTDVFRNSHVKECEVMCYEQKAMIADSQSIYQHKQPKTVMYESHISHDDKVIKLKITESTTQGVVNQSTTTAAGQKKKDKTLRLETHRDLKPTAVGPKGRRHKRRKKGKSDNGIDEYEEEQNELVDLNDSVVEEDCSGNQSVWANERMPPEILSKIFMYVTYTEGCIPTLVR